MRRSPIAPSTSRFASKRSLACAAEALVVLLAALGSAIVAHLAIDIAGDFLLAHDAYDGLAHQSRALVATVCAAALLAGVLRFVAAASAEALGESDAFTSIVEALARRRFAVFAPCVVTATLATLGAMEWLDALLARTPIDDLADLFGGSLVLGPAFAIATGALGAALASRTVRALSRARTALLCRVRLVLRVCIAHLSTASPSVASSRRAVVHAAGALLVRCGGKRGPPLLPAH